MTLFLWLDNLLWNKHWNITYKKLLLFTPLTLLETLHTYFYWFFSTFQYWPIFVVSLIQINIAYKKKLIFHTFNPFKTIFTINSQYRNSLQVIFEIPSKLWIPSFSLFFLQGNFRRNGNPDWGSEVRGPKGGHKLIKPRKKLKKKTDFDICPLFCPLPPAPWPLTAEWSSEHFGANPIFIAQKFSLWEQFSPTSSFHSISTGKICISGSLINNALIR